MSSAPWRRHLQGQCIHLEHPTSCAKPPLMQTLYSHTDPAMIVRVWIAACQGFWQLSGFRRARQLQTLSITAVEIVRLFQATYNISKSLMVRVVNGSELLRASYCGVCSYTSARLMWCVVGGLRRNSFHRCTLTFAKWRGYDLKHPVATAFIGAWYLHANVETFSSWLALTRAFRLVG